MVGEPPRQTEAIDDWGSAALLGKYVVVRAVPGRNEQEAANAAAEDRSRNDRDSIARLHRRQRQLALFLHHIGHSLGAFHEHDRNSFMNPVYDKTMNGFAAGAISLIGAALDGSDRAAIARAQIALLDREAHSEWWPIERDRQLARLEPIAGPQPDRDSGSAPISPAEAMPGVPFELHGEERLQFRRALDFLRAGNARTAYEIAKPLFPLYPDVYGVADLRCQLATIRWLERSELQAECAPITRLMAARDAGHAEHPEGIRVDWQPTPRRCDGGNCGR